MKIQVPQSPTFNSSPLQGFVNRDFVKGQVTENEADKIAIDMYAKIENMRHNKRNLDVRRGTQTLATISGLLGIGTYENAAGNKLMAVIDTGSTTSKLTEVDRDTGAETDRITGITGDSEPSFTSLGDVFYVANGADDLQEWDGTTAYQVATPAGKPELIASDESRVWAVASNILYFSVKPTSGRITDFTITGTDLGRAGIASSTITKFTALAGSGAIIVAAGNGRVEGHMIPDFSKGGLTSFPEDMKTILWTVEEVDVPNRHALKIVENYVCIKSKDNILHQINITTGDHKEILIDKGEMEELTFDLTALGYDPRQNMLFIACRDVVAVNDRMIAFNVSEQNFVLYTNLLAKHFTNDQDTVFYMNSIDRKIIRAFDPGYADDDGIPIAWKVRTAKTYANSMTNYKYATHYFIATRAWEDIDIDYKFFADAKINSSKDYDFKKTISISAISTLNLLPYASFGYWGTPGLDFGADVTVEELRTNDETTEEDEIDTDFFRAEVEISGSSTAPFSLRGVGFYAVITERRIDNITFN